MKLEKLDLKTFAYMIIGLFGVCALVFGIYLIMPVFISMPASISPVASGFTGGIEQLVLSWLYIGIPSATFIGMWKNKDSWVKRGAFALCLLYIFAAMLRLFTIGFLPLTWIFILAMGIVLGAARLVIE